MLTLVSVRSVSLCNVLDLIVKNINNASHMHVFTQA